MAIHSLAQPYSTIFHPLSWRWVVSPIWEAANHAKAKNNARKKGIISCCLTSIPPYFTHLTSCLTAHQLSRFKFLWSLVIAGVTWAIGRGIIWAVRPAPFQGCRKSLHILEMGKCWKKSKRWGITWQFSFKKQVVAGPKLIILYIISNTIQEYGLFQFRSEALGNPTKIRVKLNTLVHWCLLCT